LRRNLKYVTFTRKDGCYYLYVRTVYCVYFII